MGPHVARGGIERWLRVQGAVGAALLRMAGRLPLWLLHGIGGGVVVLLGWIPNELSRVSRANIAIAFPELPPRQRRRLVRRSLAETMKFGFEAGHLWCRADLDIDGLVVEWQGLEHLEAAHARGRGVILAIPHLGSWEVVGLAVSRHFPMTSLYRPPRVAAIDPIMRGGRERFGAELVPTDGSGVRALRKALGRGRVIAILPDQEPGKESGVFADFFGRPAWTMTLMSRLAHRSGSPVLYCWAERLPWGRGYRLHLQPAPEAVAVEDPEAAAKTLNEGVEGCIRECPEQYVWSYRRYQRQPRGVVRPYPKKR